LAATFYAVVYGDSEELPIATQIDVGSYVGYRGPSRIVANGPNPTLVTHLRLSLCIASFEAMGEIEYS
jgi:hypothetical protein